MPNSAAGPWPSSASSPWPCWPTSWPSASSFTLFTPLVRKTSIEWDDLLVKHRVITRFSHIVPAAVIQTFSPALFSANHAISNALAFVVNLYLIIIVLFVIDGGLNFLRSVWDRSSFGRRYPAKSFVQALKLIVNLIGLIFILSALIGKSPLVLFSGLGAVTAILLFDLQGCHPRPRRGLPALCQ